MYTINNVQTQKITKTHHRLIRQCITKYVFPDLCFMSFQLSVIVRLSYR